MEDMTMGAISNDWLKALNPEFAKPYYADLYKRVKDEYSRYIISALLMIYLMHFILHRLVK